ncbi:MAG: glycosyltransferase [candidate division KSB1 bacterium]|nr:glycosyltransferase [candidate division KSB1 bacterium]MDZ7273635.1 glycosyltransferase [candidate division KSB1 bacterium]MDZ7286774.1 glycosyltransferase [candidate division KSB1 bacterium]MDZ7299869.1 glycosyltransferase [candidate division KSB1 bacterium]MDZ7305806.1 glycosyltransferase [candidate division KSB1 bacterium]
MTSINKQRVAFLLSQFPCFDETFILREMAALAAAGLRFDIYSIKKSRQRLRHPQAEALLPHLIHRPFLLSREVWLAQLYFIARHPARYLRTLWRLVWESRRRPKTLLKNLLLFPQAVCYARLAQHRGVTLVHGFWATFPATAAWIIHRLTGLRYSFSAHAHDIYEDDTMLVNKLRASEFVLTCTAYNQVHLTQLVPEKGGDIKLIYHGHDLAAFHEDAQNKEGPAAFLRILSIGTLYHTKGFDTLIEACAVLKGAGVPLQCRIVGEGPEKARLQSLIRRHRLEQQVTLSGYLSQEALRPLRRWADVFILLPRPYLHWGIPNVYIEALASGVAVIATPLNAIGELIEPGRTGLIVAADDPEAAAAALTRLFRDVELRRSLAAAGRQRVQQLFDERISTPRVVELFMERLQDEGKQQTPRFREALPVL